MGFYNNVNSEEFLTEGAVKDLAIDLGEAAKNVGAAIAAFLVQVEKLPAENKQALFAKLGLGDLLKADLAEVGAAFYDGAEKVEAGL